MAVSCDIPCRHDAIGRVDTAVTFTSVIVGMPPETTPATLRWEPTVIDTDSGQSVTIREGDSLLLATDETAGAFSVANLNDTDGVLVQGSSGALRCSRGRSVYTRRASPDGVDVVVQVVGVLWQPKSDDRALRQPS